MYLVNKYKAVIVIVILTLIFLSPLLLKGLFKTDDGSWMVIRFSAFYQSLREGQFPVRFLGRLNYSYGYPVANFLYPAFMYLATIFKVLGFSYVNSVKLVFIFSIISLVFFWYKFIRLHKSVEISLLSTIALLFNPYLFYTLFKRGSIGEVLALSITAAIFYSIRSNKKIFLSIFTALLIISHNTTALFILPIISLFSLVQNKNLLFYIFIGILISVFFWVPAIYEQKYVIFSSVQVSNIDKYFVWTDNILFYNLPALLSLLLISKSKLSKINSIFLLFFVLSIFFMSPVSRDFWTKLLERIVQFPFRFSILVSLSGAYLLSVLIDFKKNLKIYYIQLILILLIGSLSIFKYFTQLEFENYEDGYYSTNESTTTVQDEYMPTWVKIKPTLRPSTRAEILNGSAEFYEFKYLTSNTQQLSWGVDAKEESLLQINTIYYPGWGVTVNNQPVDIDYKNSRGLIQVHIPKGRNIVKSEFRETPLRLFADLISVVSIFILFFVSHKKYV